MAPVVAILLCLTLFFPLPAARAAGAVQVCFQKNCLSVETAADTETRMRGLQNRKSLAADAGMLFIFPEEAVQSFWMKDTLIPLDMIWLDTSKRVVDLKSNVPPCTKDPCTIYAPSQKALYVLEVNAKYAQTHKLHVGDQAVFR